MRSRGRGSGTRLLILFYGGPGRGRDLDVGETTNSGSIYPTIYKTDGGSDYYGRDGWTVVGPLLVYFIVYTFRKRFRGSRQYITHFITKL